MTGLSSLAAFAVAFGAALTLTPVMRVLAIRWGVLDHPDHSRPDKTHAAATPYLGGVAILCGVAAGSVWGHPLAIVIAGVVGVSLLGVVGLIDDIREIHLYLRLGAQVAAALVVIVLGVRSHATGLPAIDVIITLIWVVGVTNAVNVIDTANGVAAGILAVAGIAFAVLAAAQGQFAVAALAASIAGGATGFLPYNFPKGRIFMGDAGTMPLGFLIAVVALEVDVSLGVPWGFAVPVCILGVPIVNTMIVSIHRMRIGQPIYVAGADHVWQRLVARGLGRSASVVAILAVAAALGVVGVAAGLGWLPPLSPLLAWLGAAGAGLALLSVPLRPEGMPSLTEHRSGAFLTRRRGEVA